MQKRMNYNSKIKENYEELTSIVNFLKEFNNARNFRKKILKKYNYFQSCDDYKNAKEDIMLLSEDHDTAIEASAIKSIMENSICS